MTSRVRVLVSAALLAALAASCGQQGPLILPEGARPIEPAPAASGTEQSDDEPADER
jgi:predicted small lipoprotein YifL